MAQLFANNAFSSLGATFSAVATSLTLATGTGARFPTPTGGDHFLLTLVGLDSNGNENAWEIVRVTARSTDTLTVTRAQEGTTAALWASGTRVELRATGGTFGGLLQLTGGTVTGPVTLMNGAYTAFKVGLTGLVSIGGEAGSADSRFTITNGGAVGLEFSQTAIANQNRILSYNRLGAAFVPLSLAASEVRFNISGTDMLTANASGLTYTGNFGVGTASPAGRLHSEVSGAEALVFGSATRRLYGRADSGGVSLFTGATQTGTGWYFDAANNKLIAYTNSVAVGQFDSAGNLLVNAATPNAGSRLRVVGSGSTSATYNTVLENSSGAVVLGVRNDGYINFGNGKATLDENGRFVLNSTSSYGSWNSSLAANAYWTLQASGSAYGYIGQASATTGGSNTDFGIRADGNLILGAGGYGEDVRIDVSGNLLVGTTSSPIFGGKVRVQGHIESHGTQFNMATGGSGLNFEWVLRQGAAQVFYVNDATVLASLSSTGVWTNASDARYKENIRTIAYGLAEVMQLQPRAYNVIGSEKEEIGFVAQEVEAVLPELVDSTTNSVTGDDRLTLSYGQMAAVLVKGMQEQQAQIEAMQSQLDTQNHAIALLTARLEALEAA